MIEPPLLGVYRIAMPTAKNTPNNSHDIDAAEIAKFTAQADQWWDADGAFKPLHKFNPTRLAYIKEHICRHFARDPNAARPFDGLNLLDIGCGGGLLSEPMARLGASVTGADAGADNIKAARLHAEQMGLNITYRHATADTLAAEGKPFDIILNMEVVEHVADVTHFMQNCAALLAPQGLMFFATLNRTAKSFALAIIGAEYVLGWLPRGTHDWRRFITPDELEDQLILNGLEMTAITGVRYAPLSDSWHLAQDLAVNYMGIAQKKAQKKPKNPPK